MRWFYLLMDSLVNSWTIVCLIQVSELAHLLLWCWVCVRRKDSSLLFTSCRLCFWLNSDKYFSVSNFTLIFWYTQMNTQRNRYMVPQQWVFYVCLELASHLPLFLLWLVHSCLQCNQGNHSSWKSAYGSCSFGSSGWHCSQLEQIYG